MTAVVRPRDAVRWALYYVPTLYFRAADFPAGPDWQGMVRNSIEALNKGDYQAAFEAIRNVPPNLNEPRFFAYRAALLLSVGRYDEASRDLEQALSIAPNYSDALALQAIIAVVQNDKERALDVARQAVTADPKSASALISLSYAQQARFDLDGALNSLQQAVQLDPANALAWARLAELHLSFSRLDEALEAAQKAVATDPNLSRTQTILGFAYLTRVETAAAKTAFETAIALDQADGLPRLGLGLAKIREGDLEEGRMEIDIAVSLDPDNSLFRSYLGKGYFEEKRDQQAATQYQMAKELDPKDPTPYFYDAIRKQTTNRPVEALQDMEKAIELNDNRAVYRSRLQLDSDLAARSAALGRIYSDLGFQQLALVEGWKSVNTDPTNFSAHRFLADSYSVLPRHKIARVSELLQSQLLQPLNIAPIQPQLAESNLFLISAGGPTALALNEFNPLFNRNGVNFQTTGMAGEHNTYAGEGILSGIHRKASFSLGGFHFQTHGWRRNADQNDNIANAFLQLQLSPQTSIQSELRYRNRKQGDPELNFFPDDFRPNYKETLEASSYRVGLRHNYSPSSLMLGSFMYQHSDTGQLFEPNFFIPPLGAILTSVNDKFPSQKAFSGELQHMFRWRIFNVTAGVGHFDIDRKHSLTTVLDFTPIGGSSLSFPSVTKEDVKHSNLYLYSNVNLSNNVIVSLGITGDIFEPESDAADSRDQINPKFGITWNPIPTTTIRAAAFRTLKRTLITDQTLEPTQVAGFNQFFDDFESTEAWRYGAAVDQKFFETIFGGIEFSKRDLKVPFSVTNPLTDETSIRRQNWDEKLGRSYIFWTPHRWFALSSEYQYERFERDVDPGITLKSMTTHRVPLGLRLLLPSGLNALLRATYVNQHGNFIKEGLCCTSGRNDFWLVDTGISYRLPKRYGVFSLGVTNLFDRRFKYQEIDIANPTILPIRTIFARLTLALP
jgi:tetratricopeptide (TPR) repeat protein